MLTLIMALLLAAVAGGFMFYYVPDFWYLGSIASFVVCLIYFLMMGRSGRGWILRLVRAREATPEENQMLMNVGHEMSIAAGIPMPKLYVIEDDSPNAFATGWDPKSGAIVFTTGMLKKLNRQELQGVMAHEMAHIRNYDIRLLMTLALTVGLLVLIRDIFWRSHWYGFGGGRSRSRGGGGGQGAITILIFVLVFLAPVFALMLKFAVSRKREYLADATAAQLTRYPDGLADALEKLAADKTPLKGASTATAHLFIVNPLKKRAKETSNVFSTHPPIRRRIHRLRTMGFRGHGLDEGLPMPEPPSVHGSPSGEGG